MDRFNFVKKDRGSFNSVYVLVFVRYCSKRNIIHRTTLNLVDSLAFITSTSVPLSKQVACAATASLGWVVGSIANQIPPKIPTFFIPLVALLLLIDLPTNNTSNNVGNQHSKREIEILSLKTLIGTLISCFLSLCILCTLVWQLTLSTTYPFNFNFSASAGHGVPSYDAIFTPNSDTATYITIRANLEFGSGDGSTWVTLSRVDTAEFGVLFPGSA